jgi:hypothetical protein
VENIAAIEKMGISAYVVLKGAGQGRPFFGKDQFAYDPERDHYTCPSGEILLPRMRNVARSLIGYRAKAGTCDACPLKLERTTSKTGRQILRHFDEEYIDQVKVYRGTFLYEKALRKRRVWVEPLFAEAKEWHGMRRFRHRRLEKVNMEALLIASGQNVKRLLTFEGRRPKKTAQVAALRPPVPTGYEISRTREHHSSRSWLRMRAFSTRWQAKSLGAGPRWRIRSPSSRSSTRQKTPTMKVSRSTRGDLLHFGRFWAPPSVRGSRP